MRHLIFSIILYLPCLALASCQSSIHSETTVRALTLQLIDSSNTDREKLDQIYQYVIHNINYDREAYQGKKRRLNRSSADVLRRKKAVCWGYAELMREMCTYANITTMTITGYAKELPFPARSFENANHAWNAVKLEGEWFLLDATWDSGLLNNLDYFRSKYNVDYYLTAPELFIKNHLPIMPMWQLLDCPVDIQDWKMSSFDLSANCRFNYEKEIESFLGLSRIERMGKEIELAYELNQSDKNKRLFGHGLVDIAFEKKERADSLLGNNEQFLAIELFEAALQLFEVAEDYCSLYDWQEQGYLFTRINLAQAYYHEYYEDEEQSDFLLQYFEDSKDMIVASKLHQELKFHTYDLIDSYVKVFK